ncbi:MAG: cytochrome b/b6 domain-containing protein [Mycobacteriales bacterium]
MTSPAELLRFGPASRWVHRSTAVLVGLCLATAAVLYLEPLATLVGRRGLVVQLHVLAGLALPVPVLLGRLSAAYRADLRELNRFGRADGEWLRRRDRRSAGLPVGKFNAGQKLNAALSAGGGLVLLGTGVVLEYGHRWPLPLRTGSTFVHDWTAAALLLLVLGHVRLAYRDEDARRGMRTGRVPLGWARREHPAWVAGFRSGAAGQVSGMEPQDQERVRSRSGLTPEERVAGSEDPQAQAAAVLADSDERTEVPDAAPDTVLERRTSADAADLA